MHSDILYLFSHLPFSALFVASRLWFAALCVCYIIRMLNRFSHFILYYSRFHIYNHLLQEIEVAFTPFIKCKEILLLKGLRFAHMLDTGLPSSGNNNISYRIISICNQCLVNKCKKLVVHLFALLFLTHSNII